MLSVTPGGQTRGVIAHGFSCHSVTPAVAEAALNFSYLLLQVISHRKDTRRRDQN